MFKPTQINILDFNQVHVNHMFSAKVVKNKKIIEHEIFSYLIREQILSGDYIFGYGISKNLLKASQNDFFGSRSSKLPSDLET